MNVNLDYFYYFGNNLKFQAVCVLVHYQTSGKAI